MIIESDAERHEGRMMVGTQGYVIDKEGKRQRERMRMKPWIVGNE